MESGLRNFHDIEEFNKDKNKESFDKNIFQRRPLATEMTLDRREIWTYFTAKQNIS